MTEAAGTEQMKGLALFQKVNHFPGMFNVYRKHRLASNLEKMRKAFPAEFAFCPKTFVLPSEAQELLAYAKAPSADEPKVFIAKPCDQSQGRGIYLATSLHDLPLKDKLVVQRYINR